MIQGTRQTKTEKQALIDSILSLRAQGVPMTHIAKRLDISRQYAHRLLAGAK